MFPPRCTFSAALQIVLITPSGAALTAALYAFVSRQTLKYLTIRLLVLLRPRDVADLVPNATFGLRRRCGCRGAEDGADVYRSIVGSLALHFLY